MFFLASKDEAFDHYHDLVLRLASELPGALRAIRSDNGTEFKNASFASFCAEHGIEHQFSSPHVPQQNGVVERKNRTLVEMARTMLDEYSTPRRFWAEAIATSYHISNHVFLRPSLGKTSYELRFGRKPSVSHFQVFGSKCFILKIGNLDNLNQGLMMVYFWVILLIRGVFGSLMLKLTLFRRHAMSLLMRLALELDPMFQVTYR